MAANRHNVADIVWQGPGEQVEVLAMRVRMAISDLYTIEVELKSPKADWKMTEALHKEVSLGLKCGADLDEEKKFSGIITHFQQARTRFGNIPETSVKSYNYHAIIRPKLWLLTKAYRSKVYQQLSAQDIVSTVLDDHGVSFQWELGATPPVYEYCVQYQESDYQFVSRLLEREGICFYYKQADQKVILANYPAGHSPCEPQMEANYRENPSPQLGSGAHESVRDLSYAEKLGTHQFAVGHYNYETSQTPIGVQYNGGPLPQLEGLNHYHHTLNYPNVDTGNILAQTQAEAEVSAIKILDGKATCRSFEPGYQMKLAGHFREDLNQKWLITTCQIEMEQGGYHCHFQAFPADLPYRPAKKTRLPKVHGVQTATVTGPAGSKVYLDPMGRCKLQFHWDREGANDDTSSLWVRVGSIYAGKNYGVQWIPRVGHEVLVTFIDGDPNMPVVTGRVYNDFNTAPLGPSEKWQNIIKTIQDNHILFDDEEGSERIDIRAQKNMDTLVVNDESLTVLGDRSIRVNGYHRERIGKNMEINVTADLDIGVGKNTTKTVGKDYTLVVTDDMTTNVDGKKSLQVTKERRQTIGKDDQMAIGKDWEVTIGGKTDLVTDKTTTIRSKDDFLIDGKKKGVIDIDDQLTLKCGKASIVLKKNGDIAIKGKKITITGSSDIKIKGSKIAQN